MRLIKFTARCLKYDIRTLYDKYGSRCFDLRVKFDKNGDIIIVHNTILYNISSNDIYNDLQWLNEKGDVVIRVVLDIRKKKDYTQHQIECYLDFCKKIHTTFTNITFVGGQNLYNRERNYDFGNSVSMCELYSSVTEPKIIDDWFPWIYAKLHNKKNILKHQDTNILLMDFVNIQ